MIRVAVLIDGAYFLKRLPHVRKDVDRENVVEVSNALLQLVRTHLENLNRSQTVNLYSVSNEQPKSPTKKRQSRRSGEGLSLEYVPNYYSMLYRCFYYDASPYLGTAHRPCSKTFIDYDKSSESIFRRQLFEHIKQQPNFALRLGQTRPNPDCGWEIKPTVLKQLIAGKRDYSSLSDADFATSIRQKGVDIRMGIDIASITLKKQANSFVLVTGDEDFVPAAKLARREGCKVVLDPLGRSVSDALFEHIDACRSSFKPTTTKTTAKRKPASKSSVKKPAAKKGDIR